jgi:hypothetical protein
MIYLFSTDENDKLMDDVIVHKYQMMMQQVMDNRLKHITIDLDDLMSMSDEESEALTARILNNTYR